MNLCAKIVERLQGRTLVTAESLTGGGIGTALTCISGSSAIYKGGVISYTDWVKSNVLGVNVKLLEERGYRAIHAEAVDLFPRCAHVETIVLLGRKDIHERIKFDVNVEDLHGRASATATYPEIKAYVLEKFGLKVSSLYIAQIKEKCGLDKRENFNIGEGKSRPLICPPEKEQAIMDAFRHFGMIDT